MTSHLSISYTSSATAGAPAAAASASAQANDPLGQLGALFDQLLAGLSSDDTATTDATAPAALGVPVPLAAPQPTPKGLALLDTLANQLGDLEDDLDSGADPDPDRLAALSDTIDALSLLLSAAAPVAQGTDGSTAVSTTQAGTGTAATTALASLAGLAATLPQVPGAPPSDQVANFLATLGLTATATDTQGTGTATTQTTAAADTVAALSQKLADLGAALTPTDPVIARKLEALATSVASADDASALLARLDPKVSATQASGTTLDSIVARLDSSRPVTQQIAAPTLPVAPIAAGPSSLRTRLERLALATQSATTTSSATLPADASLQLAPPVKSVASVAADGPPPPPDSRPAAEATPDTGRADTSAITASAAATAATTAAAPRTLPSAYQPIANPINMGTLAFEMVRQVHQGLSRFTIRLDPPELGRVDVRMHVDSSGAVTAKLTVDRSETLDLFQRDQRTLERALQQAGLDSTRTTLEFSLRQNSNPFAGMTGGDQRRPDNSAASSRFGYGDDEDTASLAAVTTLYRGTASAGGVNLFV